MRMRASGNKLGGPPRQPRGDTSAHSSCYFNILCMEPFFTENFTDFTIFIFRFNLITCIRTTSRSTDVQHITSLHQIAYMQRIRCIKNSP
jgi:hypothetical protein